MRTRCFHPGGLAWLACVPALCCAPVLAAPPITALAIAPDEQTVLCGSQAGIEIRSWPELKLVRSIETNLAHVHDLAFSPDGTRLAAAGGSPAESGSVEVYRWPVLTPVCRASSHTGLVQACAWHRDSDRIITASMDHTACVVRVADGAVLQTLTGHSRGITSAMFLPHGSNLVTAGLDQSIRVWDGNTGRQLRSFDQHTRAVTGLAVAAGSDAQAPPRLVSVSEDRTVRFWQPTIGRLVRFTRLPATPLAVAWTSQRQAVVCCSDGRVRVIDSSDAAVIVDLPAINDWAYSLAIDNHGRIAVGGVGGAVRLVELPKVRSMQ